MPVAQVDGRGVGVMAEEEFPVYAFDDEATMLAAVREVIAGTFGVELEPADGDDAALLGETDLGTLIVALHGEGIVSLELGLTAGVGETFAVLEYLNARNAATTFVIFAIQDERVWVSGFVDGRPFAPTHLVRTLDFMFQAAAIVAADLEVEVPA